jgi:hypothetical protein
MKAKGFVTALLAVVAIVFIVGALVWATTPTRTDVRLKTYGEADWLHKVRLFEYSWTITLKSSGDTLIVGPFDYRHVGHNDSLITLCMEPQTATKIAINWKADYQISTDLSPATAVDNTTDWKLVETESVRFDSVAYRAGNVAIREFDTFNPRRYGNPTWVRIRFVGVDSTGAGTLVLKGTVPADVQFKSAVR